MHEMMEINRCPDRHLSLKKRPYIRNLFYHMTIDRTLVHEARCESAIHDNIRAGDKARLFTR